MAAEGEEMSSGFTLGLRAGKRNAKRVVATAMNRLVKKSEDSGDWKYVHELILDARVKLAKSLTPPPEVK